MRRIGSVVPVVVTAGLLAGAALAAALSTPQLGQVERPDQDVASRPDRDLEDLLVPPPSELGGELPWWAVTAVQLLLVAVVVTIVVVLVRALVRRASHRRLRPLRLARRSRAVIATPADVPEAEMLAAVDAGLADLRADDSDPRRAVIACWLRLEEAADAAGIPRYESDTATELAMRLLRAQRVDEPVVAELAQVYQRARFTTRTVDGGMRDRAVAALEQLRAELAGAVSEP